jgi:hypothetical protein
MSVWYYQNSFLPEKKIAHAKRTTFWSVTKVPWGKGSMIENLVDSIVENVPEIQLKANIIKDYKEKHLVPTKNSANKMRRLQCSIERMSFEEVEYTLEQTYVNKRYPERGLNIH